MKPLLAGETLMRLEGRRHAGETPLQTPSSLVSYLMSIFRKSFVSVESQLHISVQHVSEFWAGRSFDLITSALNSSSK